MFCSLEYHTTTAAVISLYRRSFYIILEGLVPRKLPRTQLKITVHKHCSDSVAVPYCLHPSIYSYVSLLLHA